MLSLLVLFYLMTNWVAVEQNTVQGRAEMTPFYLLSLPCRFLTWDTHPRLLYSLCWDVGTLKITQKHLYQPEPKGNPALRGFSVTSFWKNEGTRQAVSLSLHWCKGNTKFREIPVSGKYLVICSLQNHGGWKAPLQIVPHMLRAGSARGGRWEQPFGFWVFPVMGAPSF